MQTKDLFCMCERGSPGGPDQKEVRSESRKPRYAKSTERLAGARVQPPERAGNAGCGGIQGPGLSTAAEGALGTPFQVQHLEEDLNTRLLGSFAGTYTSLHSGGIIVGPVQRVWVESVIFALT